MAAQKGGGPEQAPPPEPISEPTQGLRTLDLRMEYHAILSLEFDGVPQGEPIDCLGGEVIELKRGAEVLATLRVLEIQAVGVVEPQPPEGAGGA